MTAREFIEKWGLSVEIEPANTHPNPLIRRLRDRYDFYMVTIRRGREAISLPAFAAKEKGGLTAEEVIQAYAWECGGYEDSEGILGQWLADNLFSPSEGVAVFSLVENNVWALKSLLPHEAYEELLVVE